MQPPCSRLSGNPAHDASEWRLLRSVRGKEDGLPCCQDNRDTRTSRGNPDIRVPPKPEKEDGLPGRARTEDEEDAEETRREEDGQRTEDEARETNNDDSRIGNLAVPLKPTEQWGTEIKRRDASRLPCHRKDVVSKVMVLFKGQYF
ncbi:hypothetical protein NDU88_007563 [Pleurodeles waltl]|uniref:Uncharacterized protein n=1 Tax=Pleurodeles waltl TaxID=8319 RepID=A0AAV7MGF0_PLEWA|nr:hypothetical protein NDU88_007563 [Pleurodeles waltl]